MFGFTISHSLDDLASRIRSYKSEWDKVIESEEFGNAAQAHMTGVAHKFVNEMGTVGDMPNTRSGRGVRWKGFAVWQKPNGRMEGTRWRLRGRRRVKSGRSAGKFRALAKKAVLNESGFEKVWKKRASGRKFSDTSRLLQDAGDMLKSAVHCKRILLKHLHRTLILRAGVRVPYFGTQHERRPFWFLSREDASTIHAIMNRLVVQKLHAATARPVIVKAS